MSKLFSWMKVENNLKLTQNQALSYKSTLNYNLDLFSASLRFKKESDLKTLFTQAYNEDKPLAIANLLNILDIRGGKGERKAFKVLVKQWANLNTPQNNNSNLAWITYYGRWDYLLYLLDISLEWDKVVFSTILKQLKKDKKALKDKKEVSLLAKWIPSFNTSSKETKKLGNLVYEKIGKSLNLNKKGWRKLLKELRAKTNVVETKMSAKEYKGINYGNVPAKAMLKYRLAFYRNDEVRFKQYLEDVKEGKSKIKASVLMPHEVVRAYWKSNNVNEVLEEQWKALPNFSDNEANAIVIADVSDSMTGLPMFVSVALAMYFAQRNNGVFKNKFITFSANPTLQELKGASLKANIDALEKAHWEMNTNIDKVFKLMLDTALKNKLLQTDFPKYIVIVSDMEFDEATEYKKPNYDSWKTQFKDSGYKLPKIIFWNVSQYSNQSFPVVKDTKNCATISGFATTIFENLFSLENLTPERFLLETLSKYKKDVKKYFGYEK